MTYSINGTTVIDTSRNITTVGADIGGMFRQSAITLGSSTIDCATGNFFMHTINGATSYAFINPPANRAYAFTLELNHTSGAITWPAAVQWPGATAPALTTGRTHMFVFITDDGGNRWRGAFQVNYTT